MRLNKTGLLIIVLLLAAGTVFSQSRSRQIEIFAGGAIPLAPDAFKDFYKVGGSIHGQYVMFPSPTVGISLGIAAEIFTVDEDALLDRFGARGLGVEVTGEATIVEIGIGVRPYLTSAESSTQFFLFGMGTYNAIEDRATATGPAGGTNEVVNEFNKFGVAAGAGFELPAGDSLNLIFQGLFRFIFTNDETTSFVGITGGVAF